MTILNPLAQKIFAKEETTAGTLVFPATADAIIGAGYIESNREVSYTDSPEIRNSLNLKDQVKDKDSAGSWNVPILVRPGGLSNPTFTKPMGGILFKSLLGREDEGNTGKLNEASMDISTTDSITIDDLSVRPKAPCVILIGTELIYISHIDAITEDGADSTKYQGEFHIGDRGYNGTTVAAHTDNATITIKSYTYSQSTTKPTFSLWYEKDGVVFFCRGCTTTELSFTGSNKGYPTFELNGGFMSSGHIGTGSADGAHTSTTSLTLQSGESKYFSVGGRLYNSTTDDNNSGNGYEITDVNTTTDVLTLGTAVTCSDSDVFKGYLPDDSAIGSTLKNEDTLISMGDYSSSGDPTLVSLNPTALTVSVSSPVKYIDDEISPDAISEYTGERRTVSGSFTQLLQVSKLSMFYDSDEDVKKSVMIRLGSDTDGYKCLIYMRRCTIQVPKVNTSEPLINIDAEYSAIDDDLEDSLVIAFV